ncbi:uncharacterized protein BP5553_07531 [Venustampulla echinocandica]|uniref:Zn(2)-C6 fungal-type domain-containing protein n=1 Tax=Venustampulla echinocandica TaxID=2656787 RepID=A0A370TGT7_9HELO|nr:uncharacterized protein BP5553_07531 [Venustampulla echinocandica]RDL34403.1 hypothetical protein BP5553_07531 [Venustampulla echinocandica]
MADDIRRRSACDRCHSQKLRCPRRPGEDICDRCSKARTSCIFSPFRQKKLPQDTLGKTPSTTASHFETIRSGKRKRTTSQLQEIDLTSDNFLGRTLFENGHTSDDTMLIPWLSEDVNMGCSLGDFDLSHNSHSSLDFDPSMPEFPPWLLSKENGMLPLRKEASPTPRVEPIVQPDVDSNGYHMKPPQYPPSIGHSIGPVVTTAHPESPSRHLIHRLSQLNSDLYENAELMPPQSIHDAATPESLFKDCSKFSLEDLLRLTQTLIDIYPSFMNIFFGRPFPPALHLSNTSNVDGFNGNNIYTFDGPDSRGASAPGTPPDSQKPPPDLSSVLLIISCHLRLIGIWEQMLLHMKVCFRQKNVALTPGQKVINMVPPRLQIGSFAPPPSAATAMYTIMFCQFATQLSEHATDLGAEIQGYQNRESQPGSFEAGNSATALSFAAVKDVKARSNEFRRELIALSNSLTT